MYDIQIKSIEKYNFSNLFKISIIIQVNNREVSRRLTQILDNDDYYLCFYQNPFFWFVNLSPMIVYIRRYQSEMDSSNQLLKINKKMNYSFKRKSHCKYFKRAVQ